MPTVLLKAKDINLKDVSTFDGSPANVSLFDTQDGISLRIMVAQPLGVVRTGLRSVPLR